MSDTQRVWVLWGIEIVCVVFILLSGSVVVQNLPFLLIQIFGGLLILWAFLAMKLNHFIHVPHAGKGNFWVKKGPYEIIRHPVYAGVFLIMSGFVQWELTLVRFFVFATLVVAMVVKMTLEERLLETSFKDEYRDYKAKTHKVVPYFY